jgi:hypothetical protein
MLSRAALASYLGKTFGGNRDLYNALGYDRDLSPAKYRFRYRRNSVAARVIEAFPKGTWRGSRVELIENEDPTVITPFEKAWIDLSTRLSIWPTLMKADILAGLGQYAVVLLGGPGELKSSLPRTVNPENLVFLSVYSQENAVIKTFEDRTSSERYGQPLIYELKGLKTRDTGSTPVHWSRIIHIADGTLDEPMYGTPRLERVWNLLDDLEKITGAGAEAFWLRAHQGYQFDLDPEIELDSAGEKALSDEADEFANGLRRIVRTRGVKLNALGSDVADFNSNVLSVVAQISSGTGIPQRILLGSEQGQLASEQDRVNWSERVQDRRTEFAGPAVVNQLVNRLIKFKVLPEPQQEWIIRWPRVFDLSEGERIKLAQGVADVNQKFKKEVVLANEVRDLYFGFDKVKEDLMLPIGNKVDSEFETQTGDPTNSPNPTKPGKN